MGCAHEKNALCSSSSESGASTTVAFGASRLHNASTNEPFDSAPPQTSVLPAGVPAMSAEWTALRQRRVGAGTIEVSHCSLIELCVVQQPSNRIGQRDECTTYR
jgi:hypothetical protein